MRLWGRAKTESEPQWVAVAAFKGLEADSEADQCVSFLEGHDIPAIRLPTNNIATLGGFGVTVSYPVQVLVPPDWAEEAKGLLDGREG